MNRIIDCVDLPASADALYKQFMSPREHAEFTGKPVRIQATADSEFEAFDGLLKGSMIQAVPSRLIVMKWRSVSFHESDPDSILVLAFSDEGDSGRIDMVHVGVPDHDVAGVTKGWKTHYWDPWRAALEAGRLGHGD